MIRGFIFSFLKKGKYYGMGLTRHLFFFVYSLKNQYSLLQMQHSYEKFLNVSDTSLNSGDFSVCTERSKRTAVLKCLCSSEFSGRDGASGLPRAKNFLSHCSLPTDECIS